MGHMPSMSAHSRLKEKTNSGMQSDWRILMVNPTVRAPIPLLRGLSKVECQSISQVRLGRRSLPTGLCRRFRLHFG